MFISILQKFDFMIGGAGTPEMQTPPSWEQVHDKLLEFFKSDTSFDAIIDWISVGYLKLINIKLEFSYQSFFHRVM